MFRELTYGVMFYLFAMAGVVLGVGYLSPVFPTSNTDHYLVKRAVLGAFLGGGAWLLVKYALMRSAGPNR
jgi:hypothetical protein